VKAQAGGRIAAVHHLLDGIHYNLRLHVISDPPSHNLAGEKIENGGEIEEPRFGGNIGDIAYPCLIRRG
jgi:hypothetical protein